MKERKITAIQLAEETGLSRNTIGNIVKGRNCQTKALYEIARALEIPLHISFGINSDLDLSRAAIEKLSAIAEIMNTTFPECLGDDDGELI